MNWHSWREFVAMGGYGVYVWGSVLVVLGAIAAELADARWRHRAWVRSLRWQDEITRSPADKARA